MKKREMQIENRKPRRIEPQKLIDAVRKPDPRKAVEELVLGRRSKRR